MRLILLLSMLSLAGNLFSQRVIWADQVIDFTTEILYTRAPGQYTAKEALGAPSVLPGFGESVCAWTPSTKENSEPEGIVLGFPEAINVRQIVIHENMNPGAVSSIALFDSKGNSHEVYRNPVPGPTGEQGRLWNLKIERTKFKTDRIAIVLNTAAVPGYNQIDAVGISEAEEPVEVGVSLVDGWDQVGEPENPGPNVNSAYNELCPVISADGRQLFFTRVGDPNNIGGKEDQDVFLCQVREDGFSPSRNLGRPINNSQNNSITSITPDGQTALLMARYEPDGSLKEGISTARRKGEGFAYPVGCDVKDYYNRSDYGEFCLSSTGKVMIMTVQRKDSEGGKDLYITFLSDDGTWTAPKSLGATLNTAANETSPFLAADDQTLYFSSSGFPGFGSNDMFISRRLDDSWTNWSEPQNLGSRLNTPSWDAYYSLPASGEYAYFVSYQNSIGEADIFRTRLPESMRPLPVVLVSGHVLDQKTGQPVAARIVYESLQTGEEVGVAHSDPRDGSYSIALPAGTHYGFLAQAKDYLPVSENMDLRETKNYAEVERDLFLVQPETGAKVLLNNLFFDFGKADLTPASRNELRRLAQVLDQYPTMAIEIAGHTDNVGSSGDNLKLSQKRADAVVKYLMELGVARVRLSAKGYGETVPIASNDSESTRKKNRRVEFSIRMM